MSDIAHPSVTVPVPRRGGELVGIQYLRGIAAMMVVVFHLQSQLERMGYTGPWPGGLSSGVDIFFVISGFIMWVTTAGKPITPIDFWWRRIVRIVPLYWLITAFMTAVLLIAPKMLQSSAYDGWHVLSSYLFIPAEHPVKHKMEPLVNPGWTLNYEMLFYLIFGLFLWIPRRLRLVGTIGVLILLVSAGIVLSPERESVLGFYTSSIMLEFAFGMILGAIATRGDWYARAPALLGWALITAGFILLIAPPVQFGNMPVALSRGPFATAILSGVLILEARTQVRESPLLRALGNASYSIYLSQMVFTSVLSQVWRRLGLHHGSAGLISFSVADVLLCAAGGWLCYRLVERPLTLLLRPRGTDGVRMRSGEAAVPGRKEPV